MTRWTNGHIEQLKNKGLKVYVHEGTDNTLLDKVKRKMRHDESDLQQVCVETFRLIYPRLKKRLFSIPNGGYRNAITATILQREGAMPGCSDLMLAIPKIKDGKVYGGMFIEMKTAKGFMSDYQLQFIEEMKNDYKCVVCRSVEEFLKEINQYLKQ